MNKKKDIVHEKDEVCCCEHIENKEPERKFFKLLLSVLVLFLIFFIYASTQKIIRENGLLSTESDQSNLINISKTGTVYVTPNIGMINLTSTVEAKTIADALKENNEKVASLINFLKTQGIVAGDIKTAGFNVNPRYEWSDSKDSAGNVITGKRTVVGYEVSQATEVKIRDLSKAGGIIDGAAQIGINNIGDLTFVVESEDAAKTQAREKAIADARSEAQNIANKLGVALGSVSSYSESFSALNPRTAMNYEKAIEGSSSTPTSIESGNNKIEVTVNVSFEIK
jgi:hypothetical protein